MLISATFPGKRGVEILVTRLQAEKDPAVRASLAVGVGIAGRTVPTPRLVGEAAIRPLLQGTSEERAGAALGLAALDGPDTWLDVFPILQELARGKGPKIEGFRWANGNLRTFALAAARSTGPMGIAAVTLGLLDRIRELTAAQKGKREASTCANELLDLHFRYRTQPCDLDGLSDFQLDLLVALSPARHAPEARWDLRGLPVDVADRRRLVKWRLRDES